jgi:hypothetical protein
MDDGRLSILIVAEEVNYNRTSCGLLNAKIIHALGRHYRCTVLTQGVVPPDFDRFHSGPLLHFQFHKPFWLRWLGRLPVLRRLVAAFTGINHASYHKYLCWRRQLPIALGSGRYQAVLLLPTGMGYYAHLAFERLPAGGPPVITYIHDPYPMALLPPPYNAPWDHAERKLAARMRRLIGRSAAVWSSSLRQLEWMYTQYPALKQKGRAVHHLAMEPPFANVEVGPEVQGLWQSVSGWHTRSHFVLLHMGTLLKGRQPHAFLQAYQRWRQLRPEAAAHSRLVFVGQVHPQLLPAFEPLASLPGCIFRLQHRLPYRLALQLQQSATANLVIESAEEASPQLFGKFADAVLANRPLLVLGPPQSEARRLLGPGGRWQATNGQVEEILAAIDDLYQTWLAQPDLHLDRPDLQAALSPDRVVEAMAAVVQRH